MALLTTSDLPGFEPDTPLENGTAAPGVFVGAWVALPRVEARFGTANKIRLLDSLLYFSDYQSVSTFLYAETDVIDTLLEARYQILEVFGERNIRLSLVSDPNGVDSPHLSASIQVSEPPAVAVRLLERFDEAWWLSASENAHTNLTIDVEYI